MSKSVRLLPICYIEACERFSHLGLMSIFVFYLIDLYGFSNGNASSISASFGACIYLFGIFGGLLGDFYLGTKQSIFFGLLSLLIGYFFLSLNILLFSLFFLIIGGALIKSNLSTLLAKNHPLNTNYAFSVFYIFVNIGCFFGQIFLGFIAKNFNYQTGFLTAFFAILISIFIYLKYKNYYENTQINAKNYKYFFIFLLLFLLILLLIFLLPILIISKIISIIAIIFPIFFYIFIYKKADNKKNIKLLGYYFLIAIITYFLIFQSFNTLNIFTSKNAKYFIFSYEIPSSWYISFMFFSSFFISIYLKNITKKIKANEAFFVSFSLFFAALAFIIAGIFANNLQLFHILLIYFFLGISQLLIGVFGISITNKLAPTNYKTSTTSLWFLCSAAAQGFEAFFSKNIDFTSFKVFFLYQGVFAFLFFLVLLSLYKRIKI